MANQFLPRARLKRRRPTTGFTTITKLNEVEKHTKLHQDLCGFNKKNKLGLSNPSQEDVKSWLKL